MDLTTIIEGITLEKACSIKADKDSTITKTINLRVKFDGVPLGDVFAKAVGGTVIQWQNGPGRSKFDQWESNQTVEVDFKSPARTQVDPETAMVAKLASMTADEQQAYLADLVKKSQK